MAGKKKKNDDTVGMSKTARASSLKKGGKQEGFIASGEMDRIISLGGGTHIYLLDPRDGKTHHLRLGSEKAQTVLNGLLADEKHGPRIFTELARKGFPVISIPETLDDASHFEKFGVMLGGSTV